MADRRDYYFQQLVTEEELDAGYDGLEVAERRMFSDPAIWGVVSGLTVVQHAGTPNLTVDVATGVGYAKAGERCSVPSLQSPDMSVDSSSVSTAVTTPGNEKWVSLFLKFARALSDPRLDGNDDTVYHVRMESFTLHKVQGSEAAIGVATRPALLADGILLADIQRTEGQTQILTANISTTRRELFANQLGSAAGYAGGGNWLDGTTNPATTVEAQLDKIVADLVDSAGTNSGAHKVGCDARTTWLGGRTNPSGVSVYAAIDKIITDLAATTAGDDGAERIGLQARTAWLGGRTNAAADVFAGIDKIITDLAATTASDDGAERIGAESRTGTDFNLSSGSVASQLQAVVNNVAHAAGHTWTAAGPHVTGPTGSALQLKSGGVTRHVQLQRGGDSEIGLHIGGEGSPGSLGDFSVFGSKLASTLSATGGSGQNTVIEGGLANVANGIGGSIQLRSGRSVGTGQAGVVEFNFDSPTPKQERRRWVASQTVAEDGGGAVTIVDVQGTELPNSSVAMIKAVVLAMEEAEEEFGGWSITAVVRRDSSGNYTILGQSTENVFEDMDGAPTPIVSVSGSSGHPTIQMTTGTDDMLYWHILELTIFERPASVDVDQST